jgi:hypothetical protein
MRDGTPWPSRYAYLRCVRTEARRRTQLGELSRGAARMITRQVRPSTCGSAHLTRCCVYAKAGAVAGDCRIVRPTRCDANRQRALRVLDVGTGICDPSACL